MRDSRITVDRIGEHLFAWKSRPGYKSAPVYGTATSFKAAMQAAKAVLESPVFPAPPTILWY